MSTLIPFRERIELLPKNPYHTPGYGGYCPQYKYKIGDTFGRTTHCLIQDKSVACSEATLLSSIKPVDQAVAKCKQSRDELLSRRSENWGGQKFGKPLVPGYTGFVPRLRQFYGERYTEKCKNAVAAFETDHLAHQRKMSELPETTNRVDVPMPNIPKTNVPAVDKMSLRRHCPRLVPIQREADPYISHNAIHTAVNNSPFILPNDNPNKRFMSSYMGYVPKLKFHIGQGSPGLTHVALNEFTDAVAQTKAAATAPVKLEEVREERRDPVSIYPDSSGLIPRYTGHIPGQKFRHGRTFGHSTYDALDQPRST
ncbi:ciliary microtubule inner protein 2B-like [Liolophura sinensis]|uniref:ciliary microtubule inner protein 2B-like n=1 Tax=Liolophura sinensis TaxID=3198878 RepID=UPI003158453B